jgi:hypothetical protein
MMGGPSGTFIGHLGPGLVFAAYGLWWLWEIAGAGRARRPGEAVERTLFLPVLKIVALFVAFPFEVPNAGWEPMDWVMGWHHITIYIAFALSGCIDLAARRGLMSARATYLGLAGATFIGFLVFYGHGNDPGIEGTAHTILMLMFLAVSVFTVLEEAAPSWPFEWFRVGSMICMGAWWCVTAWLLFRSGWDMLDHIRIAHVWLRFAWTLLAVATMTTLVSIVSRFRNAT